MGIGQIGGNNMNYYVALKDYKMNGFYCEDIHGEERCNEILGNGGLKLSEDLWQYLSMLGCEIEFIGEIEEREYTILDKDLFKEVVQPVDTTPQPPTFNEQLAALGEQLTQEKLKGIQKDNTISQLGEELTQEKLKNIQKDSTISQLGEGLASVKLEVINMKGGN